MDDNIEELGTVEGDATNLEVITAGLVGLRNHLRGIIFGGVVLLVILSAIGVLYVQDIRKDRDERVDLACDAIERLAVANERFIRDVAGPGEVTDERLAIYHLYIDPAIEACRESALQGVLGVSVASRTQP